MRNFTFVFFILAFTAHGQTIADLKEVLKTKHLEGKCDEAFTTLETMIGSTKENDTLYYYRGWLHLNCSNNYDLAIADFDKALLLDQNSVYGNLGRGMALCLQGKPEEAIDYLEVARSFKPKLFETQYYLGISYFNMGKQEKKYYKNAITYFDNAIKINLNSSDCYFYRGISQFFGGKIEEAYKDLEKYNSLSSENVKKMEFYLYDGIASYHLKKFDQALERLSHIPESDSMYSEVLYFRGISQLRNDKTDEAFADLNKYLELKPNNPNLYADIAEYYSNNEDLDLAYVYYKKASLLNHKESREMMDNFYNLRLDSKRLKQFKVSFKVSKIWLVDEFSRNPAMSNCNGALINDIGDRIFIAILENNELSQNPKAMCSVLGHEFGADGEEVEYKTSQYTWKQQVSNETWTPKTGEPFPIKVWRLTPVLKNNRFVVLIWGKHTDFEMFDFYITDFMESLRIPH